VAGGRARQGAADDKLSFADDQAAKTGGKVRPGNGITVDNLSTPTFADARTGQTNRCGPQRLQSHRRRPRPAGDAAQARGEVHRHGGQRTDLVVGDNEVAPTAADLGLRRDGDAAPRTRFRLPAGAFAPFEPSSFHSLQDREKGV